MSAVIDLTPDDLQPVDAVPMNRPAAALANVTPMDLLNIVVQQGADPEKMGQLMLLQERWEANEARKAFTNAMAEFKTKALTIIKDKHVSFQTQKGRTEYDHATIGNVVGVVIPALAEHGISHKWNLSQEKDWVRVECVLTHRLGHAETVSMGGPPDDSGGKNRLQSYASTVTFLQRYTLLAACGLATSDQPDDDGQGSGEGDGLAAIVGGLIAQLPAIERDADALAFWRKHSPGLTPEPRQYDRFKRAVENHRRLLGGKQ